MKSFRICFYLVMAVCFFAARITGERVLFLLFFMQCFLLLCALMLNLWTFFSFSFVQDISAQSSVKGTTPTLKIGIYNDKPFPFTLMRVKVKTAQLNETCVLSFNLSPKNHIYFDVPLYCAYRGVYDVGMTTLDVNDIFGLLHLRFDLRRLPYYRLKKLTIYPRLLVPPFLPARLRDTKLFGGGSMRLSDEGESFSDLRAYRPGDPSKRIHWKVSAGKRELLVKSYDTPAENAAMIVIDNGKNGLTGEDALFRADLACECAAMIAHYSLRAGYVVSLITASPDREIKGENPRDFARIYDRLATIAFNTGDDVAAKITSLPASSGVSAVYIVTARRDAPFCAAAARFLAAGQSVTCLMPGVTPEESHAARALMPGVDCIPIALGSDITQIFDDRGA
ncbi:MAG: DUF58 domain-containing protein [Oscillospiraceae bacterium]|jgi:uncharacterized protein (DUF58 family)|nr:DUF58 domain-containing protein [Oscillospiraceae bacterium]